ncbi:hypothetical protein H5410_030466 [Solanum commersonii]|uniref:Uncharacterized protein n=1 Tax=Solanum commersonii TaxID=4109 RepID=A0A9J5YHH0_SOLCO|nr:hypothetical protein H5410_030466 [Solanum commersonii]
MEVLNRDDIMETLCRTCPEKPLGISSVNSGEVWRSKWINHIWNQHGRDLIFKGALNDWEIEGFTFLLQQLTTFGGTTKFPEKKACHSRKVTEKRSSNLFNAPTMWSGKCN